MSSKHNQTPITPTDSKVQKLIILFIFEKMAIPISEETLLELCTSENEWLTYMECKQYLAELIETNLLYHVPKGGLINITQDGVSCLGLFYTRIPSSLRDAITDFVNENRMRFKKRQSYFADYSKNSDGTYTVIMRINTDFSTLMELKLVVSSSQHARYIYKNWVDKASSVYSMLHDNLLE